VAASTCDSTVARLGFGRALGRACTGRFQDSGTVQPVVTGGRTDGVIADNPVERRGERRASRRRGRAGPAACGQAHGSGRAARAHDEIVLRKAAATSLGRNRLATKTLGCAERSWGRGREMEVPRLRRRGKRRTALRGLAVVVAVGSDRRSSSPGQDGSTAPPTVGGRRPLVARDGRRASLPGVGRATGRPTGEFGRTTASSRPRIVSSSRQRGADTRPAVARGTR